MKLILSGLVSVLAAMTSVVAASKGSNTPPNVDILPFNYVEMSDGVTLHATVLLPKSDGPFPAIIVSSPYADSVAKPFMRPAPILLENGYAVVVSDWRGSGCSGGVLEIGSDRFIQDGYDLVEWVAQQPWSTGAVGMGGASARGTGAIHYAKANPPSLKAIAPQTFESDIYRDMTHRGGVPHYFDPIYWSLLGQPLSSQRVARVKNKKCAENRRQHTNSSALRSFQMLAFHHDNENYATTSPANELDRIKVPTLVTQGVHDHYAPAMAPWHFQEIDAPLSIVLIAGGHSVSRIRDAKEELVAWFDHYLKGEDNGVNETPSVKAFFNTSADLKVGHKREYSVWPPEETTYKTLYLSQDGLLTPTKTGRSSASYSASSTPPAPISSGAPPIVRNDFSSTWANLPNAGLVYKTQALNEALELVGSTRLTLNASVSTVDTDFIALLAEEDDAGNLTYIQHTTLRASHRAVDDELTKEKGYIVRRHDKSVPLKPNKMYTFEIEFAPIVHRLEKGSTLRLQLLPAWVPTAVLGWDIIPVPYEGEVTVRHGGRSAPSSLSLPVVSEGLEAPMPPGCGERYYQPCRSASERPSSALAPEEDL